MPPSPLCCSKSRQNSSKQDRENEFLSAFAEIVSNMLATYATGLPIDVVSGMYSFTHASNILATVYADALWTIVLRCGQF